MIPKIRDVNKDSHRVVPVDLLLMLPNTLNSQAFTGHGPELLA